MAGRQAQGTSRLTPLSNTASKQTAINSHRNRRVTRRNLFVNGVIANEQLLSPNKARFSDLTTQVNPAARRKKSRCPGERPSCSYCTRLGQRCSYSDDGLTIRSSSGDLARQSTPPRTAQATPQQSVEQNGSDTAQRLNMLEAKLSQVLVALHDGRPQSTASQQHATPIPAKRQTSPERSMFPSTPQGQAAQATVPQVADLYLTYCHCQPLPLFPAEQFATKLPYRDEEVIFAISALALRFTPGVSLTDEHMETIMGYTNTARSLTMQRVQGGLIELSTLQSLCLLSWLDFYNGNTQRASTYIAMAVDLCKSSGLANAVSANDPLADEKLRCFWSIVLLQRLHSNTLGPLHISFDKDSMPTYPESSPRPDLLDISTSAASDHTDLGIVAYAIQLTEVWYEVARYTHRRASAGPHPPWSPKSDYVRIMAHQMDGETIMPYTKHRFKPSKFQQRSSEELSQNRAYWGPWIFTQILYHTIICVLNHPLLLSLRLKNFRVASIPEIWLQHADDMIMQHSQWVILLIDLVDSKSFTISDPFLAHCIAIVATIHLQQSFGGDGDSWQTKRENFEKCLRFCQRMGQKWPYIQTLAQKLQAFERVVSDSYLNSAASPSHDKVFIDLTLFWEILESAAVSEGADKNGWTFGESLKPKVRPTFATASELNTRLLPETARVTAAGSPSNGLYHLQTPNATSNSNITLVTGSAQFPPAASDDFTVLAQSYFAQGQDFVGNMDDWWLMDDSNPPPPPPL